MILMASLVHWSGLSDTMLDADHVRGLEFWARTSTADITLTSSTWRNLDMSASSRGTELRRSTPAFCHVSEHVDGLGASGDDISPPTGSLPRLAPAPPARCVIFKTPRPTHVEQQVHPAILLLDRPKHPLDIRITAHIPHADLHCRALPALFRRRLELGLPPPAEDEDERLRLGLAGEGVRERDGAGAADTARGAGDDDDAGCGHADGASGWCGGVVVWWCGCWCCVDVRGMSWCRFSFMRRSSPDNYTRTHSGSRFRLSANSGSEIQLGPARPVGPARDGGKRRAEVDKDNATRPGGPI